MLTGNGNSEELDYACVVASADHRQLLLYIRTRRGFTEFALENDDVFPFQNAAPGLGRRGRGGEPLAEKIIRGGADFGEVVDCGAFWEVVPEA